MRSIKLFCLLMGFLNVFSHWAIACEGANDIKLELSPNQGNYYSKDKFDVNVTFRNECSIEQRLLDVFEPTPIFFRFKLIDERGVEAPLPGAGKIDFAIGGLNYITLKPGQSHTVAVNPLKIIPANYELKPGKYSLSVSYRTQYGENNFKGKITSNELEILVR